MAYRAVRRWQQLTETRDRIRGTRAHNTRYPAAAAGLSWGEILGRTSWCSMIVPYHLGVSLLAMISPQPHATRATRFAVGISRGTAPDRPRGRGVAIATAPSTGGPRRFGATWLTVSAAAYAASPCHHTSLAHCTALYHYMTYRPWPWDGKTYLFTGCDAKRQVRMTRAQLSNTVIG